jgi:hypothetical protein
LGFFAFGWHSAVKFPGGPRRRPRMRVTNTHQLCLIATVPPSQEISKVIGGCGPSLERLAKKAWFVEGVTGERRFHQQVAAKTRVGTHVLSTN